jgi:PhzF family phenazine biosynthesis protein
MQSIAVENNLAETAFLLKKDGKNLLRWFTPEVEMDLCGHATLATAYVLANFVDPAFTRADFETMSGRLSVTRQGDLFLMNFPSRKPVPCPIPAYLEEALGAKVLETGKSRDLLAVIPSEQELRELSPDLSLLGKVEGSFAVIVTAKGESCDFASRFFAPNAGIPEDPVTGSSHSTLIPYWSEKLGKTELFARQLSNRGGKLFCKDLGERVEIGGRAVCYLKGEIAL